MIGPSGSYWSEQYYFASTGTVYYPFPGMVEIHSADRLLVCKHCGATYFFNPMTEKPLIRLACEACGSSLEFK